MTLVFIFMGTMAELLASFSKSPQIKERIYAEPRHYTLSHYQTPTFQPGHLKNQEHVEVNPHPSSDSRLKVPFPVQQLPSCIQTAARLSIQPPATCQLIQDARTQDAIEKEVRKAKRKTEKRESNVTPQETGLTRMKLSIQGEEDHLFQSSPVKSDHSSVIATGGRRMTDKSCNKDDPCPSSASFKPLEVSKSFAGKTEPLKKSTGMIFTAINSGKEGDTTYARENTENESLGDLLCTIVEWELRRCELVVAADEVHWESTVVDHLMQLPNLKQVRWMHLLIQWIT